MKFIARTKSGKYLTPRRNTGNMYESRSGWSADIEDAKIFNTAAAATNSARQSGKKDFEVVGVELVVIE
jgi:hypothetical protein